MTENAWWNAATNRAELAEAERDEALREAELSKWPKEAAQEYHRMKVDLPAAEAEIARLREALTDLGVDMAAWDAAAPNEGGHR